ncbi:MAG: hypothetical protein IJ909_04445 [Fibrobacter sp.]|nr:hypothetical protein [Fibrobacter sp.]
MSKRIVGKNTIALASAVCAASFGLFGCGSDSNGSGPNSQGDVCSVTKNGNSLTVKMEANGAVTTTIYEFGEDGNMASQSTVTEVGDNGQTACEAMNVEGVSEASFEDGKCTVKTTAGLMPGSIDQLQQAQQMACDKANEAVKPASNSSGKSGSSQGGDSDDICSVTKTATTVTVKTNDDGDASTVVYVFAGGKLTSEVMTSVLSALGDDATAEAVCKAGAAAGGSASYEKGGKCTVTLDIGSTGLDLLGNMTLDELYEDNKETCEAMKAAVNPSSSGSEGTTPGSSGSGSTTKSSASAGPKEKVVTFEDGIMYTASYNDRVRTFFNTVDEYTFFDDNAETKDSSGWWFSFDDSADKGSSMVFLQYGVGVDAEIDLVYKNWSEEGSGKNTYMAPHPYPYGAIGFNMSPTGGAVDMSDWEGICVTYSATDPLELTLKSSLDGESSWYAPLLSASMKTVNLKFSATTFGQPTWSKSYPSFSQALSMVEAIHFKYSNDESGVSCTVSTGSFCPTSAINSVKIFKIGKYGACGS